MSDTWWVQADELDEDQMTVVEDGGLGSCLVVGPPGSGKSNLLLLRANYHVHSGRPDLAVVVFTRQLAEFLRTGASHYRFPSERIQTSMAFFENILSKFGLKTNSSALDSKRREVAAQIRSLIFARQLNKCTETILLDEAQDYLPEELDNFFALSERVFAVADDKQRIYVETAGVEHLAARVDRTMTLRYHYRSGLQICRVADHIGKLWGTYQPMEPTARYDEEADPSIVERNIHCSRGAMAECIVSRLERQLKAFPDAFLGVIVPLREDLYELATLLRESTISMHCSIQAEGPATFDPARRVCVSTVHSAKGLEFRAVHLACAEGLNRFNQEQQLAYVAVTRAKTSLTVHHCSPIPAFLEGAVEATQVPRVANRTNIFGGF